MADGAGEMATARATSEAVPVGSETQEVVVLKGDAATQPAPGIPDSRELILVEQRPATGEVPVQRMADGGVQIESRG